MARSLRERKRRQPRSPDGWRASASKFESVCDTRWRLLSERAGRLGRNKTPVSGLQPAEAAGRAAGGADGPPCKPAPPPAGPKAYSETRRPEGADAVADRSDAVKAGAAGALLAKILDAPFLSAAYSVLLHAGLLAVAAGVYSQVVERPKGLVVTAAEAEESAATFDTVADFETESGGQTASESEAEVLPPVEIIPEPLEVALPAMAEASAEAAPEATAEGESTGEGVGDARGEGSGRRLAAPSNAVQEGRFTAWTIPVGRGSRPGQSPRPGQAYHIVIELELPSNLRRYSVGDLRGVVIGTDGYHLQLPMQTFYYLDGKLRPVRRGARLPIVDHRVQVLVYVPGAQRLVKDTIRLGSRRLAETQELQLVFGS